VVGVSDDVAAEFGDDEDGEAGDQTAGTETAGGDDLDGDPGDGDDAGTLSPGDGDRNLRRYLNYAAIGVLALLALVATLRFYFAASATIDTWVTPEYRPPFQAAFNLVVLLAAVGGLALQLRRLDR
jgi:hypothetical protein